MPRRKRSNGRSKAKAGRPPAPAPRVHFDGRALESAVEAISGAMDDINRAREGLKFAKKEAVSNGLHLGALMEVIAERRAEDPTRITRKHIYVERYRRALGKTPLEELIEASVEAEGAAGETPTAGAGDSGSEAAPVH